MSAKEYALAAATTTLPNPVPSLSARHDHSTEYDSLLELHETQDTVTPPTQDASVDLESVSARASATSTTAEGAEEGANAISQPRKPMTDAELRALRVVPIDNVRALTITFLILSNAAIVAVSTHSHALQLHELAPMTLALVNIFTGMTRLLVVPFLFFLSGFSSQFGMAAHDGGSPIFFILRRVKKLGIALIGYFGAKWVWGYLHPFIGRSTVDGEVVPYYASKEGVEALLLGPIAYVLTILALDFIYAVIRCVLIATVEWESRRTSHFINSVMRFKVLKYCVGLFVEIWVFVLSGIAARHPPSPSFGIVRWMYATNSAELHFPVLYLAAYISGIQFVSYYKFLLAPQNPRVSQAAQARATLIARPLISVSALCLMYYNYPKTIAVFLDIRRRPTLTLMPEGLRKLPEEGAEFVYAVWLTYVIIVVPEALLAPFWTLPSFAKSWGNFSKHAHLQVYIGMVFIVGNAAPFLDNVFMRWAYLAGVTMLVAHYLGVGGVFLGDLLSRGWNAIWKSRTPAPADVETPAAPGEIAL
ncbi:hypothetical protein BDN70DRAFT_885498 [Pholiota conissans]|uniref:Uncharacterized protein n=1 Tax=Pholiota conissans TaxID=109636 RepID=A0A9P6CPD6_9AGAR|nr:hypothetical protein BDN70DRAFT_885498 [Pholiota conissans]